MRTEWEGRFSHLRDTQGQGADTWVMDGKQVIFPWKGVAAQKLRLVVTSQLISVASVFLHDWNNDRDILIPEFAHNLLLGVKEDYVHRMKGITEKFISKNCLGNKKNKTVDKGLSINLQINPELMLWIQPLLTGRGVVPFPCKWLVSYIIQC